MMDTVSADRPTLPSPRRRFPRWVWIIGALIVVCGGIALAAWIGIRLFSKPTGCTHPDGCIAFVSNRDGAEDIYVMNGDGSEVTCLTCDPPPRQALLPASLCWQGAPWAGSTLCTPTAAPARADAHPSWSPDGRQIAFQSDRDGGWEIYLMNADGSHVTRLTHNSAQDEAPDWSPDGNRIAFHSNADWTIYVMDIDGSHITRLTDDTAVVYPDWSPDGSRIAFHSYRDALYNIYLMDADGSHVTRLTSEASQDVHPDWSPDGSRIAFESARNGGWDIYVMNADGSHVTRLNDDPGVDRYPVWSPDGRRIAFQSNRDGGWAIYVMDADGSNVTQLTTFVADEGFPAWIPAR